MAKVIADRIRVPTLIVQEGGYDVNALGECVVNFLKPFYNRNK